MVKIKKYIPTEQEEAETFADYLRKRGLLFTHLSQETSIKNWGSIMRQKRAGKNKGFPDYAIVFKNKLLFVELKRTKGSQISPEQEIWIKELNKIEGVLALVCYGAKEAINVTEESIKVYSSP